MTTGRRAVCNYCLSGLPRAHPGEPFWLPAPLDRAGAARLQAHIEREHGVPASAPAHAKDGGRSQSPRQQRNRTTG